MPVVLGLAGQPREQVPDPGRGQAHPPTLGITTQQHLSGRHTHQLGITEHPRAPRTTPSLPRSQHMIIQIDVECDQKGVKVVGHTPILDALRHTHTQINEFTSTI